MIDRRHVLALVVLLAVLCTSAAHAAKKKDSASTPTPAPTTPAPAPATPARRDSLALAQATRAGVARTPGPLVRPGSPVADRTTIAPFPIPGDTARNARELARLLNVPRVGETLVEPLPRTHGWKLSGTNLLWAPSDITGPDQVDVLPEQLTELAPEYPKPARDAGIQGMVMVMALVKTDGTVGETRVVKSIPALDDAAVQAVKRLRFKAASYQGKPVAVWVGVPVRFTLH